MGSAEIAILDKFCSGQQVLYNYKAVAQFTKYLRINLVKT